MQLTFDLEKPIFHFSGNGNNMPFSRRDSFSGVIILGASGSGKTTGPGAFMAKKYLSENFGGCVLTSNQDEKDLWIKYCRETNRLNDLIIVEPGGQHSFNFLDYEASNEDRVSYTQNIAKTLKLVIQSVEEKDGGKSDDPFWDNALSQLVFFTIDLCLLAYGKLSVQQIYDVALSAPQKDKKEETGNSKSAFRLAYEAAQKKVNAQAEQFVNGIDKEKAPKPEHFERIILDSVPDARRMKAVDQFFAETFRDLSDKTRSIVLFSFTGFLFNLLQEPIYSLFCHNNSTFSPEDCRNGKIILLNLPLDLYDKSGRDVQILFKYLWQKSMQRTKILPDTRPVFLFVDESQLFLFEGDSLYLTTARKKLIANVFMSQNLPNYYAFMGGGDSRSKEYKVKSLLGNFATKIFACNTCVETNNWASQIIGSGYAEKISQSATMSGNFSSGRSTQYELEPMVRPELFGHLLQGGPPDMIVETYVHRQGKLFDNGHNFKKVIFKQN